MTTPHRHREVLIAIAEGREAEYKANHNGKPVWIIGDQFTNAITHPHYDWRIVPTPRTPRRIWVAEHKGALCKDNVFTTDQAANMRPGYDCVEFVEVLRSDDDA